MAALSNSTYGKPAAVHQYLSTACLHGEHGYCQSKTGSNGTAEWVKTPASCKFCGAACGCTCHGEPRSDEDRIRDAMAEAQDHPGRIVTR